MKSQQINVGITTYLLSRDKNWSRFQDFAIDLLRVAEGVDYNSTVQYDDRGRDARTALIAGRPIENAICCAVKDDDKRDSESAILRKAKSDLERLKETGIPKRITFCFNAAITEKLRDKFLAYAGKEAREPY